MPIPAIWPTPGTTTGARALRSLVKEHLPVSGVSAARGNVMLTSVSEAGRVIQSATGGAVSAHWREVGHFFNTGSGNGAATLATIHFN